MTITLTITIPEDYPAQRLDLALAQLHSDYSRAQWQQWIKDGCVTIDNDVVTKTRYKVQPEQIITLNAELDEQGNWEAQDIPLDIVFEDDALIIVNKPAGLVVHPGAGNPDGTLVNALLHYDPTLVTVPRAGIVHRIDKDTSGLLVIARNLASHNYLTQAISNREVKREYQAIVHGEIISGGTIEAAIGRHATYRTKMAVVDGGRDATTHYRVLAKFPYFTHIKCELESGRTHQIRVHMTHIGHPIVGDPTYGYRRGIPGKLPEDLRKYALAFPRQALHAWRLSLVHPTSNELMEFEAPLPDDMQQLLTYITP
ncbi:MAG: 23S rRNA pseudouridine(1911/1915/1917) synthase RluD [Coxiella sp. (in: Bacteria)]|nr:MAG: 23S rRNA pseudouridine(1911/1915/1917) synthase RluD [Coxiella sp. (in: g-proteobacteria)]